MLGLGVVRISSSRATGRGHWDVNFHTPALDAEEVMESFCLFSFVHVFYTRGMDTSVACTVATRLRSFVCSIADFVTVPLLSSTRLVALTVKFSAWWEQGCSVLSSEFSTCKAVTRTESCF